MSNRPVTFSWVDDDEEQFEMNHLGPFGATGTATYPTQSGTTSRRTASSG